MARRKDLELKLRVAAYSLMCYLDLYWDLRWMPKAVAVQEGGSALQSYVVAPDRYLRGCRDLYLRGYGRPGTSHTLAPVYAVLRAAIEKRVPEKGDLESFVTLLNEPITLVPFYKFEGSHTLPATQGSHTLPATQGSHILLATDGGRPGRAVATAALEYINTLAQYGEGLDVEPVSVCPWCEGLFLRKRASKRYCSPGCRFGSWATDKGNEYFAEKARENRAAKKNLKKHQSKGQSLGPAKTVGKSKENNKRKLPKIAESNLK